MKKTGLIDKFLAKFTGSSPFVPQIFIGLGATFIRPIIIATNKKEDPDKRIYAAARTFAQEIIALPIALIMGYAAGKLGGRLSKSSVNTGLISALTTTAGMGIANLFIPGLTTMSLHKLPIKEKVKAWTIKKNDVNSVKNHKFDAISPTPKLNYNSAFINFQTSTVNPNLINIGNKYSSGTLKI